MINVSMFLKKRLPPFGKMLKRKLLNNAYRDIPIFIVIESFPWKKTRFFTMNSLGLAFPPLAFPDEYEWPVNDHAVLVLDEENVTTSLLESLAKELLLANATVVCVQLITDQLIIYRK